MRDNATKVLRIVRRVCANVGVKVLKLDLLSSKVVAKAAKLGPLVLVAKFILKLI